MGRKILLILETWYLIIFLEMRPASNSVFIVKERANLANQTIDRSSDTGKDLAPKGLAPGDPNINTWGTWRRVLIAMKGL